jgi:release factor glutamine methyltransferase
LLVHVLRKPLSFLIAHPETTLTPTQNRKFRNLVSKRRRGVPFAYLTGHQGFYGRTFRVTPATLIPRPETELLVDLALRIHGQKQRPRIADIGTGSGCIAVTLAKELPRCRVSATDISSRALRVAQFNARKHNVNKRVAFTRGSLLSPLRQDERPHVVIANLPYLPVADAQKLKKEPQLALAAGKDGLTLVKKLIQQAAARRLPHLLLEIDPRQQRLLAHFLKPYFYHVAWHKDAAGRVRVVELLDTGC